MIYGAIALVRYPLPKPWTTSCRLPEDSSMPTSRASSIVTSSPPTSCWTRKGTIKILDMGLARVAGWWSRTIRTALTGSGQVMGTCDYMAPEQALDAHHADRRADIYSLGCTLYRLLTGQVPYPGDSLAQIILAHHQFPVPSLWNARPHVSQQLDAVFQKMVAKDPENRYRSMAEVIVDSGSRRGPGGYVDVPTETFPLVRPGNRVFSGEQAVAWRRRRSCGLGQGSAENTLSQQAAGRKPASNWVGR